MLKNYFLPVVLITLIVVVSFFIYKSQDLYRAYKAEVSEGLERTAELENGVLTAEDIKHLPEPVQKYLDYTGVIGREKVRNARIITEGQFKTSPERDWARMNSQQYNFFDSPKRIYYLQTRVFGLPVLGLHTYKDASATMLIKVAGLLTVVHGKGPEMDQGETVTVFNDMCLLAPASLIDKRIQWETVDPLTVKAVFNNNGINVSAVLYFNDQGQLVNFVSEDRYYSPTGKTYQKVPWSTPVRDYKEINGVKLATYGEAIWHFPDGDYSYGKIRIKDVEYNTDFN